VDSVVVSAPQRGWRGRVLRRPGWLRGCTDSAQEPRGGGVHRGWPLHWRGGGGLGQGAGADLAIRGVGEKKREDIGSKPVSRTIKTRKVLMFFFTCCRMGFYVNLRTVFCFVFYPKERKKDEIEVLLLIIEKVFFPRNKI
jgi:hypothetical protein